MQSANTIDQSKMMTLARLQNRSLPVIYLLVAMGLIIFAIWAMRAATYHFLWRRKKYTPRKPASLPIG